MKKSIILLAVILMTLSASAQMYIWKNGEIIDEYNILDVDSVTFRRPEVVEPELTYELRTLTFEDADAKFAEYELAYCGATISTWSDLIASPEYGADMLYAMMTQSEDDRYAWYDEGNTFLASELPYNYYDYVFWGGGHAISNYASSDYTTYGTYENQLTVYGNDQTYGETLTGGYNGSANFCMHFGYKDSSPYNGTENLPYIYFKDGTPRVIDYMYVNNSTYAISCYMDGNGLTAKIGPDDWVKVVAIGYDADGNEIVTMTHIV